MSVLKLYRSPRGFAVVPVHYTHDPEKNTPEWLLNARKGYADPSDWAREMEIDFSAHVGAPCYPQFSRGKHLRKGLPYYDQKPLVLFEDFNVAPMCWGVGQVVNGQRYVLRTFSMNPATTEGMVAKFRDFYPDHAAGLIVYGDASGNARGHQGQVSRTDYQIQELEFRGYPSAIEFRVPVKNPAVKARVHAVNRAFYAADGQPGVYIDAENCPELIADCTEVVWKPDGKDILKVSNPEDPYSQRTHISDAFGYWIAREWPVGDEKARVMPQTAYRKRPRAARGRGLGAF